MHVEIPLGPRRALGVSVRTMIIMRSAVPAFVAHALVPFSTQSFPSLVACDRSDAASEPASASDSANPASSSPRAIGFSQRSFWAGVPCFTSIVVGIALWMPIDTASAASAAEISSSTIRYVTLSRPMPSYSSGGHMPRKPSLPSSSTTSRGKWLVRSHSAANGSIFSRANSRASSTTCSRTSVAVDIEPLPRFPAQLPGSNHFLEQRRRTVLAPVEPVLQQLHDGETDIEPDQVGQRQRTQRMVHAELHDLIDAFGGRDSILHAEDRLVDHRHEHSIRHEPGRVVHDNRGLAQLFRDLNRLFDHPFPSSLSPYHFDERHERDRVHEVHPDDTLRPVGLLGDFRDGDRGRIRREDRTRRCQAIEVFEHLKLDVRILGCGLHDDLDLLRRLERGRSPDPLEYSRALRTAYRALFHLALEILFDRRHAAGERVLGHIDQRRVPPMLREDVGDAISHRSRTHDGDLAHPASHVRGCFQRAPITASVPAISTSVVTIPPSGPNAPPSTHACRPGVYSTTGTLNARPLTGASNRIARPAFQPKCSPQASAIPPAEKNANDSQIAASATFTVLKKVAWSFLACASPKRTARISIAGSGPSASARRRSG